MVRGRLSAVTVPSGRRVEVRARSPLITAGRCSPTANFRPVATTPAKYAVDDGLRLIKGHYSLDVSCVLSDDQQPLQILRVTGGSRGGLSGIRLLLTRTYARTRALAK